MVVYVTTLAKRRLGLAHHGFDRGLLGDVRADGDRRRARLTHTFRGLLGAADVAISGGGARSRTAARSLALATPRARDQRPLAGQSHGSLPLARRARI